MLKVLYHLLGTARLTLDFISMLLVQVCTQTGLEVESEGGDGEWGWGVGIRKGNVMWDGKICCSRRVLDWGAES